MTGIIIGLIGLAAAGLFWLAVYFYGKRETAPEHEDLFNP